MIRVDGVFDIETEAWDKFVLGGLMDAAGDYRSTRDESEFCRWLLQMGGHLWTWNGGLFDSLWLGERLRQMGLRFTCATAGTRVTRLECEGLVVRDAFALVPFKLQKAARLAGIELTKDTGLDCRCGEGCGGYCAIRRGMSQAEYARLDRYLRLDNLAALKTLEAVEAEAERCGYLLTGTVGGSSYRTAEKMLSLDRADWPERQAYEAARDGYYGGRVEVFQPRAQKVHRYDINSAYPAALAKVPVPTGTLLRLKGARAARAFERGREGIFVARVRVPPDLHLPPLPTRTPKGRIVYPVGAFTGSWSGLELRGARARGVRLSILAGLVWTDAEPVLAPALKHVWDCRARARAEGNEALVQWHKWFGNSLTGKLAEAPEKDRVVVNPRQGEVDLDYWRPLDRDGRVWSVPFYRISDCAHVQVAAYLTAATRLELLAELEADGAGGRTAVYCDTDSVFATEPRTRNLGAELGEWKPEGVAQDFEALAPKVYRYQVDGRWHVRGKGLPGLDSEGFERFARGEPVVVERGVMGLRSAARSKAGSLFSRKRLSRRNHSDGIHYGGRLLAKDGISTRPCHFMEVVSWERKSR